MQFAALVLSTAALISLCVLLLAGFRDIRAERKRIEESMARRVREHPHLFPEKEWDKYRHGRPGD